MGGKIEITPAMIEAGAKAVEERLWGPEFSRWDYLNLAECVLERALATRDAAPQFGGGPEVRGKK